VGSLVKQVGGLTDVLLAKITRDMLRGVHYLHSNHVIHRDIKGGNVLLTLNGCAKLADFGCSKLLNVMNTADREKTLQTVRGSVPWMAPEMVRGRKYHFPADIWSLGATVLEMSSGKRPWPDVKEPVAAIYTVGNAKGPPPIPNHVSITVRDFLCQCFDLDPARRATAASLLEHSLVRF